MAAEITIKVKRLNSGFDDIELPEYSTHGSAGMDVRAAVEDKLVLKAGEIGLVPNKSCC